MDEGNMPIFEYRCSQCGKVSEFIEKFDQPPQIICPECKAHALKKLVSAGNFHLKGSGWYVTDFKDKGKNKTADSSASPDKSSSSKDDKPAAKTEKKPDKTEKK